MSALPTIHVVLSATGGRDSQPILVAALTDKAIATQAAIAFNGRVEDINLNELSPGLAEHMRALSMKVDEFKKVLSEAAHAVQPMLVTCPECGCSELTRHERFKSKSGAWVDTQQLACGYQARIGGQSAGVTEEESCTQSESAVAWRNKRKEIAQNIILMLGDSYGAKTDSMSMLRDDIARSLDFYRDDFPVKKT